MGSRHSSVSPPAANSAHRTIPRSKDGTASEHPQAQATLIQVRCPHPPCGQVYDVNSKLAGKKGRCAGCGTVIPIPGESASRPIPTSSRPEKAAGPAAAGEPHEESEQDEVAGVPEVRVGCIGRGHAGKTALLRALNEGPVGDFFPSGLHVDLGDPREVARTIRETEETQRLLQSSGLPPTLQPSQIRYCLYDGDEPRAVCKLREVIGQVLTHTLPDSAAEQQGRYADYLKSLVNTHALWVVVPCPPPNPGPRDRRRYANDLRITLAYLREALRRRSIERPVAVALVLTKIDTLFENAEEAREALSDHVLHDALGPLIQLIDQSARVSNAVITPVTAFGFGNAILREGRSDREGMPAGSVDEPFGEEPIWLLREGAAPEPYNLDALFLWTLLLGLLPESRQSQEEPEAELDEVCRMLSEDLRGGDPWIMPVKGGRAV